MPSLREIPELQALDGGQGMIRIPHELDVPLTPRVRQLIDTPEFRRLAHISQLGLVSLVYPAAHHTRFEHALGVYRLTLLFLQRLSYDERFAAAITSDDAELLIAAALLHDLGHWPFCHPIEDLRLPGVPTHELFANSFLLEGEMADALRDDWGINPRDVVALLSSKPATHRDRILQSILSGPIDVDKMDYLNRDSLHAGVPYGRQFDQQRLIASLTLNADATKLAITEKGRTAAEMMVFARYVMFSEVYWHHAVAQRDRDAATGVLFAAWRFESRFALPAARAGDDRRLARSGRQRPSRGIARRAVRQFAATLQAAGPIQHLSRPQHLRTACKAPLRLARLVFRALRPAT